MKNILAYVLRRQGRLAVSLLLALLVIFWAAAAAPGRITAGEVRRAEFYTAPSGLDPTGLDPRAGGLQKIDDPAAVARLREAMAAMEPQTAAGAGLVGHQQSAGTLVAHLGGHWYTIQLLGGDIWVSGSGYGGVVANAARVIRLDSFGDGARTAWGHLFSMPDWAAQVLRAAVE